MLPLLLALAADTAAPVYVAVVPLVVAGDDYGFRAEEVRLAVQDIAIRRLSMRALTVADLDALAGDPATRLRDCGGNAVCIGNVLGETTVQWALMVVVNVRVSPPVVSVRAIAAGPGGAVRAEVVGGLAPDDRDLTAAVARCASTVLDQLGHRRWARVAVSATPLGAIVRVDTPASSHLESASVVLVPAGRARVRVEAADHHPAILDLELSSDEDRAVTVVLEPTQRWWQSPWFWGVVGVGVGVAAGVTAAAVAASGATPCACVGHPAAPCACP